MRDCFLGEPGARESLAEAVTRTKRWVDRFFGR